MKIKSVKIKNFRGYRDEMRVDFDDLTVLIGKMKSVNPQFSKL